MLSTQLWSFSFRAAKSISPSVSHSAGSGCRLWEAEAKGQHQNLPMQGHSQGLCSSLNLSALYSSFLLQQNTWWYESKLLSAVLSDLIPVVPCQVHGIVHSHSYYFSLVLYATTFFPVNDTFLNSSGWAVSST